MPDSDNNSNNHVTVREFELLEKLRQGDEKLHQERNSAVHLRIAAVEAACKADRDLQAIVNQRLGDRIDLVGQGVDAVRNEQHEGFKDLRHAMMALAVPVLLVLVAVAPGLLTVLKVVAH